MTLTGTRSSRDGLGAIVKVHAGEQTYMRVNDGKSGYLSQSALPLYFGLGDSSKVDSVEVIWPSGSKQSVTTGIPVNGTMKITEPK